MKQLFSNLAQLFFPITCLGCGNILSDSNELICPDCVSNLPYTYYSMNKQNLAYQKLAPFISIESAYTLFFYKKHTIIQNILHQLKYKNHKEIGKYFGKMMAQNILDQSIDISFDVIIPIPLHPKKLKKRGYNQLSELCKSLSQEFNCKCVENLLIKTINNDSQTRKNASERKKNVQNIFKVTDTKFLQGKHILLIDDVMTTGATLESAARELLKVNNIKLSIATLAIAEDF